jgi:hypothetical protein
MSFCLAVMSEIFKKNEIPRRREKNEEEAWRG